MMLLSWLLSVAAHTPLPVTVQNWPGVPGPDKVALDTLKYARWAFWATVAAAVIAVFGTGFAFVDYLLNIRQFRKPKLRVSLWEDFKQLNFGGVPIPGQSDSTSLTFPPELQLVNDGKRSTKGCFVSIWIPRPFKFYEPSLVKWKTFTIGEGFHDKRGITYDRIETFIEEPVFLEHPIILPVFSVISPDGEADIEMRWQVFCETGKSPIAFPGYLHCGVRIMSP